MGLIRIKTVKTASDLRKYIAFAHKLYKDNPYWTPEMRGDLKNALDRDKNPAFEYCESRSFLALEDGEVVGVVTAIHNRKANDVWNEKAVRFWQVDFIEKFEVAQALFLAVEDWAKSLGCVQVQGPLGFCDLDKQGMLVEGFDEQNLMITIYNYPYYAQFMERMGYSKKYDWIEKRITVPTEINERVQKLSDLMMKRHGFELIKLEKGRDVLPYIDELYAVLNAGFAHLDGVVPLTRAQVDMYLTEYLKLLRADHICIVMDKHGKIAGFGLAIPSLGKAARKAKGRLFPFGIFHLFKALKQNDSLDLFLVAVRPDLANTGVAALMLHQYTVMALKHGIKYAETGPELELNLRVQGMWSQYDARQHRRRRCYIKELS